MSKFLTYEDRMNIALGLKEQLSFTVIADSLQYHKNRGMALA